MYEGYYSTILLIFASLFLVTRAIIWQILLKYIPLSKVYPYTSLVQVLILLYSIVIFNENITVYNLLGLMIMLSGIYYISREKTIK